MNQRRTIILGVVLLLLTRQGASLAQSVSATSAQEQGLTNTQEIVTGNQTVVLQSTNAIRSFAIPGSNPLPPHLPVPSHFAQPVMDGNFGSLAGLLGYKNVFTAEEAEALVEDRGKVRVITTCFLPEGSRNTKERLQVLPDIKEKGEFNRRYEQIGVGNYKALNSDTISEQVLGVAIQEGLKIGADAVIFQEGASLIQVASGFSIGLFNSFSFVNNGTGNGTGNVSVGGIGYGKGKSAYASNPWLRILFFRERASSKAPAPNDVLTPGAPHLNSTPKPPDGYTFTRLPFSEELELEEAAERMRLSKREALESGRTPGHRTAPKSSTGGMSNRLPSSEETAKPGQTGVPEVLDETIPGEGPDAAATPKKQNATPPRMKDDRPSKESGGREERAPGSGGILRIAYKNPMKPHAETQPKVQPTGEFYQVKEGETLAGIAGKVYADPLKWPILYRMNLDALEGLPAGRNMREIGLGGGIGLRIVTPEKKDEMLRKRANLWVVNVLSATTEEKVSPIVAELARNRYPVYLSTARVKEKDWIRVRVGFFMNRAEAEAQGQRIMGLLGIDNCWVDKVNGMEFREFAGY
jgi:hypothetical protein